MRGLQSALAVAIVNINVPLLMGELVNAVSKFTAQTASNFIDEVRKPVMKLVATYVVQVWEGHWYCKEVLRYSMNILLLAPFRLNNSFISYL